MFVGPQDLKKIRKRYIVVTKHQEIFQNTPYSKMAAILVFFCLLVN